ncbi:MAG TPA: hypothetical protein VJ124_23905 [Pyrinomonadaceae bacterium]|nr:hypothetical protein [Pyrinomonadaceae bacterium]
MDKSLGRQPDRIHLWVPQLSIVTLLAVLTLAEVGIAQTPRDAEGYNNRGLSRQNSGDVDGAIED